MSFNSEAVKTFVKDGLGCTCPDDVFDSIKYKQDVELASDLEIEHLFIIGNRLLIFIKMINDIKHAEKILEKLINSGKVWREEKELNRFRLVLIFTKPKRLEARLKPIFNKFSEPNENIHLHIITKKMFRKLKFN